MKKTALLIMITAVFGLTSCTTTLNVTSIERFNEDLNTVKSDFNNQGYVLAGVENENKTEVTSGTGSFWKRWWDGTLMYVDQYVDYTYTFSNSEGNDVEILLRCRQDSSMLCDCNYYKTVELLGCKTSKREDYEKMCGENSMVNLKLGKMEQDKRIKIYDTNTIVNLVYISAVVAVFSTMGILVITNL